MSIVIGNKFHKFNLHPTVAFAMLPDLISLQNESDERTDNGYTWRYYALLMIHDQIWNTFVLQWPAIAFAALIGKE